MDLIERLRALARHEHSDVSIAEEAADAIEAARGCRQGEQPMTTNVQLIDELREVSDWFRLRGLDENAALLDHAAHALQCAANFFAWYNRHHPSPSSHPLHPWCILGAILTSEKNDTATQHQEPTT